MRQAVFLPLICALFGCAAPGIDAPGVTDLSGEAILWVPGQAPEAGPGICWGSDVTPAIIETVTEQKVVDAEQRDGSGVVISPATYRTTTSQRMVKERSEVWFRVPCPEETGGDFVATLQRALKARGLYPLPLTGVMDAATQAAVRTFQAERGLDSAVLSLAAARELGLITVALDDL